MTEQELKKIMLDEENKIIREATIYCGNHTLEFSREHNKLTRLAIRRFYREVIYPHLRELNINAPRKYED
jgi:hypothetical protein